MEEIKRVWVKFYFKLKKTAIESSEMFKNCFREYYDVLFSNFIRGIFKLNS